MRERQSNESKEVKTLRELRRQIIVHPVVIEEIKQVDILAYSALLIVIAV